MLRKVYLVYCDPVDHGMFSSDPWVKGVFSTQERADQACKIYRDRDAIKGGRRKFYVRGMELDPC